MIPSTGDRGKASTWILLALLLAAGLGFRVWYLSWDLHADRFEDEKYSLRNVRSLYYTGDVKPVNAYYPSPVFSVPQVALMKASNALYEATGKPVFRVVDQKAAFQPAGIFLGRLVQALCGTASILLVFAVGRHVFQGAVGLLGALIFAFAPWAIHSSGYNKPDSMLVMATLLSLYASLLAVEKARPLRYVAVGVAIALAMSAKLTGGLIAVPLMAATAVLGWQDRRRIGLLVLAGATSVVAFIALNPYWQAYFHFLKGLKRDYAMRADWGEMSRWQVPAKTFDFITDRYVHGLLPGTVSLIALALIAASLFRSSAPGGGGAAKTWAPERVRRLMFVAFPPVYAITYMVQTAYFKPNNFLPVVPYTSLALAWTLVEGWRLLASRFPALGRSRPVAALAVLTLALLAIRPGASYVYRSLTPTTRNLAVEFLVSRLDPLTARWLQVEEWQEPEPAWEGRWRLQRRFSGVRLHESLHRLGESRLDLSDGLAFRQDRLAGEDAGVYQPRVARAAAEDVRIFAPRLFESRGPAMVAIAQPHTLHRPVAELAARRCGGGEDCLIADLPADLELPLPGGDSLCLQVWIPRALLGDLGTELVAEIGGVGQPLARVLRRGGGFWFVSERFHLGAASRQIRFAGAAGARFGDGDPTKVKVQLLRWSPPV